MDGIRSCSSSTWSSCRSLSRRFQWCGSVASFGRGRSRLPDLVVVVVAKLCRELPWLDNVGRPPARSREGGRVVVAELLLLLWILLWPSRTTAVVVLATGSVPLVLRVMWSNRVAKPMAALVPTLWLWLLLLLPPPPARPCVTVSVSTEVVRTGRRNMPLGLSARKRSCASANNSWASGGSGNTTGGNRGLQLAAAAVVVVVLVLVLGGPMSTGCCTACCPFSAAVVLSVVGTLDWLIFCANVQVRWSGN
jgi:hypothetical protein